MERPQHTPPGQEPDQILWTPEGAERPQLHIRAAQGADEERLERMFFRLSPRTLYLRFLLPIPVAAHQAFRVTQLARVESDTSYAAVACEGADIRGIARYDPEPAPATVELSVLIEDAWQGCGLGKVLAAHLIVETLRRGITQFTVTIAPRQAVEDRRLALLRFGRQFHLNGYPLRAEEYLGIRLMFALGLSRRKRLPRA